MLDIILKAYGFNAGNIKAEILSEGLINRTWKIQTGIDTIIVQQLSTNVFKQPELIGQNIDAIDKYLKINAPGYLFTSPLKTVAGSTMFKNVNEYYRVFPFIHGSHTITRVFTAEQAYEAAFQFGQFTHVLKDFDVRQLKYTIPDFHNLSLRYNQFITAIKKADAKRLAMADKLINELYSFKHIKVEYESLLKNFDCKIRVTHHDTKISNVLFDTNDKGICVIDLDTVMPGYFISDVGDMMRTYLCAVTEEEMDFEKIEIRKIFYEALCTGYIDALNNELTNFEKKHFLLAGKVIIYMQALRFLTDYLQNDMYYVADYPEHNFNRAKNQTVLLQQLCKFRN